MTRVYTRSGETTCQCFGKDDTDFSVFEMSTKSRGLCGLDTDNAYFIGSGQSKAVFLNKDYPTDAQTCDDQWFRSVVSVNSVSFLNLDSSSDAISKVRIR